MALGANVGGLTVSYQGILCLPAYQIARPTGLEPGYGFVGMELADLKSLGIVSSIPGVDSPASLSTVSKATPNQAPPAGGLNSIGDLVVTERLGKAVNWTTTHARMLVTEKGIETILAVDGGSTFVKVELADIRYLWGKRGIVSAWINVPQLAAGQSQQNAAGDTPSNLAQTEASPPVSSPSAGATVGGTTDAKIPPLIVGSLDEGGKPWTLRRVLEVVVLPALPGTPKLKRLPADLDGDKGIPLGHVWDGVLPVRAMGDLLDEFQLALALNLDGSVSLWHEGEGTIAREDGTAINFAPGKEDEYVTSARDLVTPHYIPSSVVVLGPPIRDTSRSFLEPVGQIRKTGQIVPLADALSALGVTLRTARIFVLASALEKALIDLPSDAVHEIDRWCFRWFRIPGGAAARADWLPIRDRGHVDDVGTSDPPRVWSENLDVIDSAAIAKLGGSSTLSDGTQISDSIKTMIASQATQLAAVINLPWSEQSEGYEIDRAHGLVKFREIQVVAQGPGPADPLPSSSRAPAQSMKPGENGSNILGESLLEALGPLGWAVLAAADRDKKIRRERAAAALAKANAAAAKAVADRKTAGAAANGGPGIHNAFVQRAALVQLEWGWDRKPGLDSNVEIFHRYASFWTRGATAKPGVPAKITQQQTLSPGAIPLTIHRPDLLEVHDADGNTNKAQLDSIAKQLATAVLTRPEVTTGSTLALHRPVAVQTNGLVTTTVYSTSNARPRVSVHVGSFAPLTAPHAETHARVPRYQAIRDSVLVPRGGL